MRLLELRVRNFRQHRDARFQFAAGLNVVVGPNEAGKSALRDALRGALFANPTSDRQDSDLRPWGGTEAPVLELVFEIPQGRFELIKDFAANRMVLRGQGRTWERSREVQEAICRALGFHSEKAFLATAHVKQAELDQIQERGVAAQLGRIVAGADEDASRALQALQKALQDLERGLSRPATNPGRLYRLQQRFRELQSRAEDLRRAVEEARRTAQQLADLRRQLAEVDADLQHRMQLLELNRQIQQAREKRDRLRREVASRRTLLQQVDDLQEQVRRARETLAGLPEVDEEQLARVGEALSQAEELEFQASELEPGEQHRMPEAQGGWTWVWGLVAAAAAAILLEQPVFVRAALALFSVGAVLLAWRDWHRAAAHRQAQAEARAQQERNRLARQLREKVAHLRAQAQRELKQAGVATVEELRARLRRRRDLEQAVRIAQHRLQDLLAGREPAAIAEELESLSADLHAAVAFLESEVVRGKSLLPLDLQRLEAETQRLQELRGQLSSQLQRLEGRLEAAPEEEELLRVEEELDGCRAELERLERRARALRVAAEVLQEAKSAVEVPARRAVGERAGQSLARLTGGRYTRVRIPNGESLRLEVWSDEAGLWLPPEEPHLSRGTVDLVYLAARVALVDVLAPQARTPLLLDDPFVTLDPDRRHRALDWLRELARDRQVFLFTWDEAVARHADAVVRLPPPAQW